jgi:hypothetical protein
MSAYSGIYFWQYSKYLFIIIDMDTVCCLVTVAQQYLRNKL